MIEPQPNGHAAQPENFVLIAYDAATQAFNVKMGGSIPRPAYVNLLELLKLQQLQAQQMEMARQAALQQAQQKSLLLPDGTPFRG